MIEPQRILPVARCVTDYYKSALYTGAFQDQNFRRRPGLGFIRLVTAIVGDYDRLDEYGPDVASGVPSENPFHLENPVGFSRDLHDRGHKLDDRPGASLFLRLCDVGANRAMRVTIPT